MLAALALCVALGGPAAAAPLLAVPTGADAPRQAVARVTVAATVEILEPVTNVPRGDGVNRLRVVSRTRDGRSFVEYQ